MGPLPLGYIEWVNQLTYFKRGPDPVSSTTNERRNLMKVPTAWAPLVISAVRDAILYQESLLRSDTIKNKEDYEEHIVQLSELLEELKLEYKKIEGEAGIALDKLV